MGAKRWQHVSSPVTIWYSGNESPSVWQHCMCSSDAPCVCVCQKMHLVITKILCDCINSINVHIQLYWHRTNSLTSVFAHGMQQCGPLLVFLVLACPSFTPYLFITWGDKPRQFSVIQAAPWMTQSPMNFSRLTTFFSEKPIYCPLVLFGWIQHPI